MKKHFIYALFILITDINSFAQNYPSGYFIAPLDPPLILSGTFGEVRENHFHSGLDFSTDEEEGIPIMATAEGYISRIKIAPDGYGKALYITHPNGYVTVYGHLQKFTAQVNSYIRKLQYERQVFEMDINPKENEFIVKQRDVIAYSGNTGGSEGPHVHFEIRDEKTEEPINPLHFGLSVKDNLPPSITQIRIFPVRENGILNKTDAAETYDVKFENGIYLLDGVKTPMVYGMIGFGFYAVDFQDTIMKDLGIYASELYVDGQITFTTKIDRFNFKDTRYANSHIDYGLKYMEGIKIERIHKLPGDRLKFYNESYSSGIVNFTDNGSHDIRIVVMDFFGNKSEINFKVNSYESLRQNSYRSNADNSKLVTFDKGLSLSKPKIEIVIPDSSFYENFYFSDAENPSVYLSDIFTIGNLNEPLHHPMTISIKPNSEIVDSLKIKAVVVRIDEYGEMKSCGGLWRDKFLMAKSYTFGNFAVILDTVPPVIEKYYTPADMNTMYGGQVQIRVKDQLSGIRNYSGKINGKWHLFEYDKKSDLLIANVDNMDVNETHPIEVTATDENGNTTVWKSTFYY